MYGNFTVEITGVEYPNARIHFLRDFKFIPKIIEVDIPKWVAAITGDETIKILRDGVAWTEGRIKKIHPYRHGDGVGMKLTGYTNEWGNNEDDVASRTYNADPKAIIEANLNARISAGTINTYGTDIAMEFGATDNALYKMTKALTETTFVTGWETYLSPASALDFKSACGTDRSATIKFIEGDRLRRWKVPHTKDITQKVSKVVVLGAFITELKDVCRGVAGTGTPVHTEDRKNLINNATCALAAAAIKADMDDDLYYGSFWATLEDEGVPFDVYDTIYVGSADLGVDGNYRISRIEVWVDKSGPRVLISYCSLTKMTCNGPILLERSKGQLVAGQRAVVDMSRQSLHVLDLKRAHKFHKFQGEHELGYDIFESGGTLSITRDKMTLTTGLYAPDEVTVQSAEMRTDFAKKPSIVCRFKINDVADNRDRETAFGAIAGIGGRSAGCQIDVLELKSYTHDGTASESKTLLATLVEDHFYLVEIYVKTGKVEFYLDGVLTQTHTVRVPSSELAPTLWANSFLGNNVDELLILEISDYEVNQEW